MKTKLNNDKTTTEYLNSLPKIYLVACWVKYGVLDFPLVGWKKVNNEMIPLVYDYYDGNGTCDVFILKEIIYTTTGSIVCWTMNKNIANMIADRFNKIEEVE